MEDRVLTGRGSRVLRVSGSLSPRSSLVHGLTGDCVAGVLWSRRRHPSEDRTPSPSTLPISSFSQQLSALTSLGSLSVSSLYFSPASVSLTLSVLLCSCEKRKKEDEERRRRTNKKRKEEKKSGRGAVRELKEEGEVGWVAREVGGERVDRIGLLSILLFYF
jgi:hypothetical protein